jgi:putative NADH-flavin reductase
MRLTVFGATGRTGRPPVEQAVERGHDVTAFVHDPAGLPSHLRLRDDDRVRVVEGDVYAGDGVERALIGDDAERLAKSAVASVRVGRDRDRV